MLIERWPPGASATTSPATRASLEPQRRLGLSCMSPSMTPRGWVTSRCSPTRNARPMPLSRAGAALVQAARDIAVESVMTNNGSGYVAESFRRLLQRLRIRHLRTRPIRPRPTARPSASSKHSCASGPTLYLLLFRSQNKGFAAQCRSLLWRYPDWTIPGCIPVALTCDLPATTVPIRRHFGAVYSERIAEIRIRR